MTVRRSSLWGYYLASRGAKLRDFSGLHLGLEYSDRLGNVNISISLRIPAIGRGRGMGTGGDGGPLASA